MSGFCFFLCNVSWLFELKEVAGTVWGGIGAVVGLSAYLALYFGVFGAFAVTVGRWTPIESKEEDKKQTTSYAPGNIFALGGKGDLFDQSISVLKAATLNGAAWCGLEWVRGILLGGFGWNGLGVALKDLLMLVQFVDVIGIAGYGFVMMFAGCVGFATIVRLGREVRDRKQVRPHLDFAVAVAMIIGLFLYGFGKVTARPKETVDIRARIMQMNIPLEEKWSQDHALMQQTVFAYRDLTRTFVETAEYDLVLWPETSLPGFFSAKWVQELLNDHVLKGDDFYLLSGLEETNFEGTEIYNTITLMKGDTESYQMHQKVHLVPFGEKLPLRGTIPIFEWILGGIITQDFTPGDSLEQLTMEKDGQEIGIIPLICFEDTLGRHARKFIKGDGPELIVNVTNDGWFHDSSESEQHFVNAMFRCIELRRPMIRAANTGVSGFIDERGSIFDRDAHRPFKLIIQDEETGDTFIRGSLPATVRLDKNPPVTMYARIGDAFSIGMGLLALSVSIFFIGSQRKKRRSDGSGSNSGN